MTRLAAVALALLAQGVPKELKKACDTMEKLPSYHFKITVVVEGEVKNTIEGEWFTGDAVHFRMEKGELAKKGDKKLVKSDAGWREPVAGKGKGGRKMDAEEMVAPHDWARKLADACEGAKREKSVKVGAVTCDLYVHSLRHEAAKKGFEGGGMPLIGSMTDWSKAQNGVLFTVGRDDLFYKIEQRIDTRGRGDTDTTADRIITMEFSEHGKARCLLPADVKEKLGIK